MPIPINGRPGLTPTRIGINWSYDVRADKRRKACAGILAVETAGRVARVGGKTDPSDRRRGNKTGAGPGSFRRVGGSAHYGGSGTGACRAIGRRVRQNAFWQTGDRTGSETSAGGANYGDPGTCGKAA